MTLPFANFECDKCGACCQSLIVEADFCDAQREPRLYQLRDVDRQKLREGEHAILLWDSETKACPFLDGQTKLCGIYPTRPNCCVWVQPGDAKCQQARRNKKLPPLQDRDGNAPTREMLETSCEEYDMDLSEVLEDDDG